MDIYKQDSDKEHQIKEFYSKLKFPGPYSIEDLEFYDQYLINPYLKFYDDAIQSCKTVLDVGCGSGFIVNLFARKYPSINFDAVDFSDSIGYAQQFSKQHKIKNITYYKENFLEWDCKYNYDLVLSNGVLHHMPNYHRALEKICELSTDRIVIGIYNSYGKLFKKIKPVTYINDILYADQELCPFETAFSDREFRRLVPKYQLIGVYPSYKNHLVDLYNLFNYSNGGLTIYLLKK